MNWKFFLALPVAALLLGKPLHAPRLRDRLPSIADEICDYPLAVKMYLQAYAYQFENRGAAALFWRASDAERKRCAKDTSALKARNDELRKALFP